MNGKTSEKKLGDRRATYNPGTLNIIKETGTTKQTKGNNEKKKDQKVNVVAKVLK